MALASWNHRKNNSSFLEFCNSQEVLVFYRKRTNTTIREITTRFAVRFR
jgi:hypothetical protein